MRQRSVPKKVLKRGDDPHNVTWTESITVTGTDSGGVLGVYVSILTSKYMILRCLFE